MYSRDRYQKLSMRLILPGVGSLNRPLRVRLANVELMVVGLKKGCPESRGNGPEHGLVNEFRVHQVLGLFVNVWVISLL